MLKSLLHPKPRVFPHNHASRESRNELFRYLRDGCQEPSRAEGRDEGHCANALAYLPVEISGDDESTALGDDPPTPNPPESESESPALRIYPIKHLLTAFRAGRLAAWSLKIGYGHVCHVFCRGRHEPW